MSSFLSALGAGVSSKKILDFLMRKQPELRQKITSALASGITADKIIKFFSKDQNFDKLKGEMENDYPLENNANPLVQAQNVRDKNLGSDIGSSIQRNAPAMIGSVGAIGAGMALQHALPNLLKGPISEKIQTEKTTLQPHIDSDNANIIPKTDTLEQPEVKTNIVDVLWNDLEKTSGKKFGFESDAFLKIARRMKSTGEIKSKEDFQNLFNLFEQKKNEGKDLPSALREASNQFDLEKLSTKKDQIETPKIEKKSIVSTPAGFGYVKELRNGQAIVDIDGKMHKVKEEELEASPLPEKDLGDLYDELIGGIEKESGEDVSRMVQWAGYNPETNTLQFLPHTGALYTYDDISEEDAALLRDILSTRKSSGENFIGAWKAGSKSPIGAALSKLIRKLQSERGGKGNEYLAKHEPIYSAYEPAIQAKKRKKKK